VPLRILLLTAVVLAVVAEPASARSTYCSPSGDLCYAAQGPGATVKLRITLAAGYFRTYRLCVTSPGAKRDCRRFRMRRTASGQYDSKISWARRFPNRGPGRYRARWYAFGNALGPPVQFAEGPSIRTSPARVRPGGRVRVFGLAGGCAKGDQVTLTSAAFGPGQEFAGVPAVFATVDGRDGYGVEVTIPADRAPGRYTIGGRCGGGNFGVEGRLEVSPAAA
jgi:hypothetical protein